MASQPRSTAAWKAGFVAQPPKGRSHRRSFLGARQGALAGSPRQRALARRGLAPSLHVHLEDAVGREQRVAAALPPLAASLLPVRSSLVERVAGPLE